MNNWDQENIFCVGSFVYKYIKLGTSRITGCMLYYRKGDEFYELITNHYLGKLVRVSRPSDYYIGNILTNEYIESPEFGRWCLFTKDEDDDWWTTQPLERYNIKKYKELYEKYPNKYLKGINKIMSDMRE